MRRAAISGVIALLVLGVVVAVTLNRRSPPASTASADSPDTGDRALSGHERSPAAKSWSAWPQALHDAQHSGASPYAGPRTGHLRWSRALEGDVTPGPVVGADGTVYAASNAGVLHAIDPATGKDRWRLDGGGSYGSDLSTSPAVLPDGLLLWPGPDDMLLAVTAEGDVAWRLDLGGQGTSPAVLANGDVVVGTTSGQLLGLHPDAGGAGEQWRLELGEQSYGSAVFSPDGTTAYQSVTSGVVAVRDGTVAWRWSVPSQIVEVSPAVAPDGTVVIGTNDPYQYGLDPEDGSVVWKHRRGSWTYSSPGVSHDGIAYFGDHGDRVSGLDVRTGKILFSHQGSRRNTRVGGIGIWTSVALDEDHTAYVGTRQGLVYAVDRDSHRIWTYDARTTVDSYPALTGDGALVVGTTGGRLLAFGDE